MDYCTRFKIPTWNWAKVIGDSNGMGIRSGCTIDGIHPSTTASMLVAKRGLIDLPWVVRQVDIDFLKLGNQWPLNLVVPLTGSNLASRSKQLEYFQIHTNVQSVGGGDIEFDVENMGVVGYEWQRILFTQLVPKSGVNVAIVIVPSWNNVTGPVRLQASVEFSISAGLCFKEIRLVLEVPGTANDAGGSCRTTYALHREEPAPDYEVSGILSTPMFEFGGKDSALPSGLRHPLCELVS